MKIEDCYFIEGPWAGRCSNLPAYPQHITRIIPPISPTLSAEDFNEATVEFTDFVYHHHSFRTPDRLWHIYAPEYMDDDMIMSTLVHAYTEANDHGMRD